MGSEPDNRRAIHVEPKAYLARMGGVEMELITVEPG
jgi:hypothetical protein